MTDDAQHDEKNITPAGGKSYFITHVLGETKAALKDVPLVAVDDLPRWTVMYRGGTAFRVAEEDVEFKDEDRWFASLTCHFTDEEKRKQVLASNQKVWRAQQALPGKIGRAVRQAYQCLIAAGYPRAGTITADRSVEILNGNVNRNQESWLVQWPCLDGELAAWSNRAFNVVIVAGGKSAACRIGCDLRQFDYLFPEVAAVLTPQGVLWEYNAEGQFTEHC